jgi:hypothetical protein
MSWPLLMLSGVLIALGGEALWLSKSRAPHPRSEEDKALWGDAPREVSDTFRASIVSEVVVRPGRSTRVLGVTLLLLGLVVGAVGAGVRA